MLDGRGDHLAAPLLRLERRENGRGVGLGSARCEDDLRLVLGPEKFGNLAARLLDRLADLVAEAVHRRGIAELLGEERQHGLDDRRVDHRGGVVVHVDISHGLFLPAPAVAPVGWAGPHDHQLTKLFNHHLLKSAERGRFHDAALASPVHRDIDGLALDLDQLDVAAVGLNPRADLLDDGLDSAAPAGASSSPTISARCGPWPVPRRPPSAAGCGGP